MARFKDLPGNKIEITIELGSDAMHTYAHIRCALDAMACELAEDFTGSEEPLSGEHGFVRDCNGNKVLRWEVKR